MSIKLKFLVFYPPELSILGGDFLRKCQIMHDGGYNWKSGGLSSNGKEYFDLIVAEFC